ncbi:MAG: hypothetical protein KC435_05185 [Thermomicrobiales bacterium]|nr:hypothetical protein [Thermomicrobiales bacterium]
MNDDEELFRDIARQVNGAHAELPEADDAPVALWQHIRSQYQPNREGDIMHVTASPFTPAIGVHPTPQCQNRSLRYFANVAATIAVVAMLALGGWFAAMNLRPTGDSNNGMAFAPATPDSAQTCDVEPLSAERVMEIVKNPIRFMENGPAGEPRSMEDISSNSFEARELYEAAPWETVVRDWGPTETPTEAEFESGSDFANRYLACVLHGTQGQVWAFYNPVHIQVEVLYGFPVFSDEAAIQSWIEEVISRPATDMDTLISVFNRPVNAYGPVLITVNPDPQLALAQRTNNAFIRETVSFGVKFFDADGKPIYLTNGVGSELITNPSVNQFNAKVSIGRWGPDGNWYVLPDWWR